MLQSIEMEGKCFRFLGPNYSIHSKKCMVTIVYYIFTHLRTYYTYQYTAVAVITTLFWWEVEKVLTTNLLKCDTRIFS